MEIKELLNIPHNELDKNHQLIKIFYISEFLRIDENFNNDLKKAIFASVARGNTPSKEVTLKDFNKYELSDYLHPIEQHDNISSM